MSHILINKAIFFPEQGILAFGDVHLGYEKMLMQQGIHVPLNQYEQSISDLKQIKQQVEEKGQKINKIIILGDLKHHFGFKIEEKFEVRDFIDFIEENITNDIILIKGNHEKFELDNREYKDFHIEPSIQTIFIHGHKDFLELHNKNINTIVMTHLHTAIILKENNKQEKYKAYLTGIYKNKNIIILPSFFTIIEGTNVKEPYENAKDFSIIHNIKLKDFNVHIVGKDKIYEFGKLKDLD